MEMASANFIQQMPANLTEQQKERWIKSREEALKRKAEADQREQRQSQATLQNGCGNPMPSTSKHSNAATFIAQHQYKNQQQFPNVHRKDPPQKQPLAYVPNIPTVEKIQPEKPSLPPICRSTNPTLQVSFDLSLFDEDGQRFKLIYNPYRDFINDKIKEVPSRIYEQADRSWTFALKDYELVKKKINELRIHKIDIKIEEIPLGVRKTLFLNKISPLHNLEGNSKWESDESILNTVDHRIRKILFPFQRRGVCFGIRRNGRLLIADEMGLGKTVQAIAIASSFRVEWPLLIVCPSSVKYMWQRQIFNFLPDTRPYVIERKVDELPMSRTTDLVIIMSYDLMSSRINELKRQNYYVVIFDECHLLKESKTIRTKTATELAKQASHVLLLSGTPALSRPAELFTQIRMIDPKIFTNYKDYAVRYCDGQFGRFGFEAKGQSNAAELKAVMNKIMIRRLKKDVLEDLPAKRREIVYLTGDVIKNKMKELKNAKEELQRNDRFTNDKNMKTQSFMEYYVLTGQAKMEAIAKHIIDTFFYKDAPEKKILVFAHHLGVLDHIGLKIASEGIGFIRIDGGTNARDRQAYCEQFQTSPKKKVALLSITAAGTGITLTAASIVIFAELYWNPSLMIQAEDRAHRVGQQDSVQVQYMLAKNTADSVIWQMISSKLQILGNVNLANESYGDAKSSSKLCVDPNEQHLITDFYSLLNQMDEEKKEKENDHQSMKGMDIVDFEMDGEDEPKFKRAKSSSDLDEWDESELIG